MGLLSFLGKLNPVSAVLGGISNAQAKNRGEKLGAQMDLEQLLLQREAENQRQQIAREAEGRAGSSDAYRKLLSAQHLLFPGQRPTISPYSAPPRPHTDLEQTGADALSAEVVKRLQMGNPIPAVNQHASVVDPKLMSPGLLERILGYGGLALGGASAYANRPRPSGPPLNV